METPRKHHKMKKRVATCQVDFCRAKSVKWARLYSMKKAKELDYWLGLKGDGFEQALWEKGDHIYICTKHFEEAERVQMEGLCIDTEEEHLRIKNCVRVRTCVMDFCRARGVQWMRLSSMTKAKQLDHWLGLKTDGFEQTLDRNGHAIYICASHFKEAERVQQSLVGFLRLVEGDVSEFCGDAIVSDVNDGLPQTQAEDRRPDAINPFVTEMNQLSHEDFDRTVGTASKVSEMETPRKHHNMKKRVLACQMDFCRARSVKWSRLYSMKKARQLDHWLGLQTDGFEQKMRSRGAGNVYICTKHIAEAEKRKQQSIASFLQGGADIAVFPEPGSDVNDRLLQDDDSSSEDVKPSVAELNQLSSQGALDGTVGHSSEKERNGVGMVILRTSGPRCETYGVPTRTEEIALRLCYWKCLKSAVDRGLLQICFPLIGTGLGGYPRSEGLLVALGTILAFFEANPVKGLNVSICVSGAGARDVLEFGAILMGNDLTFKMEKDTVRDMRNSLEQNFATLMGLTDKHGTYELPTTKIRFPSYVKYWTKEEHAVLENEHLSTALRKLSTEQRKKDGKF